ncbi:hypothetical protein NDN11_10695 [Acinetobacter sp. C26M]|uniref:hypothetical protein n=1 Tax=unclassified Acinetobacter TaxID=196816 RepID=UPI002036D5C1|nr:MULTISPECIES: hypothetical protein [unclassified Acinetobacter]USA45197.1 hypothetical protein NDN11_10695 [Acinetobacter sp. C26M]USA48699.1 hypothetical protein NDN12_10695 [Acinetobacter sp. C26G]
MDKKVYHLLGNLHDARLYGFLLDVDPQTFSLNVLLYVHIFSTFEDEKYSLEKALVVFEKASIHKFSITNDLSGGQFYIVDCIVKDFGNEEFKFIFTFNDPSIELILIAENMSIKTSGIVEEKDEQLLPTNWLKLLEHINAETLLEQIEVKFKNITLGNNYTLAEEDYADTSYWYFDETQPDSNLTEEEWAKQEIRFFETCGWLSVDQEEAIQAIKEKRKMANRFSNPLDIPVLYLNCYSTGYSYLKPQAYLFYTPTIMKYFLSDTEIFYSNSFTSWLNRLIWADTSENVTELLQCFSKDQVLILKEFLLYAEQSNIGNEEFNKALDNLKLIRGI